MAAWAAWAALGVSILGSLFDSRKERKTSHMRSKAAREGALIELALNRVLRENLGNYQEGLEGIYGDLEKSYLGELTREEQEFFDKLALAVRSHASTAEFLDGREALATSVYGDWQEEAVRRWQIAEAARENGHEVAQVFGDRALTELRDIRGLLGARAYLRQDQRGHAEEQREGLLGFAQEEREVAGALLDVEAEDALADAQLGLGRARAAAKTQDEDRTLALGQQTAQTASSGLAVTGASALSRRDFTEQRMLRAKQQEQAAIMRQTGKSIQAFSLIGFDGASEGEHARYMQQVEQLRAAVMEHGAMLAREDAGGVARANAFIGKVSHQISTSGVRRQQVDLRYRQQLNAIEDQYTRQGFQFDAQDLQDRYTGVSANLRYQRSLDQQQQLRFNTEQQWRMAANQIFAGDQAALRTFEGNLLTILNQRSANDLGFEESEIQLNAAWAAAQQMFERRTIDLDQRRLSDDYNLGNRWASLQAADQRAWLQYRTGGIYTLQAGQATLGGWTSALSSIFAFAEANNLFGGDDK